VLSSQKLSSLSPGNAMLKNGGRSDGERLQPEKSNRTDLTHGNLTSQEDGGRIRIGEGKQVCLSCCGRDRNEAYGL